MSQRVFRIAAAIMVGALASASVACSSEPGGSGGDGDATAVADGWTPSADAGRDGSDGRADGALPPDAPDLPPGVVSTGEGPVEGERDSQTGVWSFKGIPYAKPPTGQRRWRAPKPPAKRRETLQADAFAPSCPQNHQPLGNTEIPPKSEDCLYLNVWSSELRRGADRPVMFWIHGGGLVQGSAGKSFGDGTPLYDGATLAERDVVVVSINYRLGPFGFLAHPSLVDDSHAYPAAGNYGILDQIRALEWVRQNIAAFGGDPENVTIFGESAGGVSTCALMATPKAQGLFDRAIMQSGNCLLEDNMKRLETATRNKGPAFEQGRRYAGALGCDGADDVAKCMRSKSASDVVEAREIGVGLAGQGDQIETFEPVIDGEVFDQAIGEAVYQGDAAQVPFVAGVNANEARVFMPSKVRSMSEKQYRDRVGETFMALSSRVLNTYPASDYQEPWHAWSAIWSDLGFVCPTKRALIEHADNGNDAYFYVFSHVRPEWENLGLGAFHGAEIPFVFHDSRPGWSGEDRALADRMTRWWIRFARDGEPGAVDGTSWPAYDGDRAMEFDGGGVGLRKGFHDEACGFWTSYIRL